MDIFSEFQTALQSDLSITSASSLFPLTTQKLALNRAYLKIGALFRWPKLEDAKKTSTAVNQEYYDAPTTWRPDSMWRLEIDGVQYGEDPDGSPIAYEDYLQWRADDDNDNSTDKKWSTQWHRFFVYPVPTSVGSNNICVWGVKNVETLTSDSDTTIFSYSMPECNDAIVLEASAILRKKGEDAKMGQMLSAEAIAILTTAYNKIRQEKSNSEKTQPFLNVGDMFRTSNSNRSTIGNFDF
jgi:hypothetical protein